MGRAILVLSKLTHQLASRCLRTGSTACLKICATGTSPEFEWQLTRTPTACAAALMMMGKKQRRWWWSKNGDSTVTVVGLVTAAALVTTLLNSILILGRLLWRIPPWSGQWTENLHLRNCKNSVSVRSETAKTRCLRVADYAVPVPHVMGARFLSSLCLFWGN